MRIFFTLTLAALLLSSRWTAAQPTPAAVALAAPTAAGSPDTAAAVHRLFSKRRTGGIVWGSIGGAFAGYILGASAGEGFRNVGGTVGGIAVLGGIPGGIGLGKLSRFSRQRETEALLLLRERHQLPPYVRRRLRAGYFRP